MSWGDRKEGIKPEHRPNIQARLFQITTHDRQLVIL